MGKQRKERVRKPIETIIKKIEIGTSPTKPFDGDYSGFETTLRADPSNTGIIYVGTNDSNMVFPLQANESMDTISDLDTLWFIASVASQYLYVWADRKK